MTGLTVLVDDVRSFRDDRRCRIARSSAAAVLLLMELRSQHIDDLWLDHDLVGDDTIWPVVHLLDDAALAGRPFSIGTVHVHASRTRPAHEMVVSLRRAGYRVERSTALLMWRHGRSAGVDRRSDLVEVARSQAGRRVRPHRQDV